MCKAPTVLADGTETECRLCWQCRDRKITDWVGRCIAESKTAVGSHAVTLTYGVDAYGSTDHARTAVLTYSDVQKYLKKWRQGWVIDGKEFVPFDEAMPIPPPDGSSVTICRRPDGTRRCVFGLKPGL